MLSWPFKDIVDWYLKIPFLCNGWSQIAKISHSVIKNMIRWSDRHIAHAVYFMSVSQLESSILWQFLSALYQMRPEWARTVLSTFSISLGLGNHSIWTMLVVRQAGILATGYDVFFTFSVYYVGSALEQRKIRKEEKLQVFM